MFDVIIKVRLFFLCNIFQFFSFADVFTCSFAYEKKKKTVYINDNVLWHEALGWGGGGWGVEKMRQYMYNRINFFSFKQEYMEIGDTNSDGLLTLDEYKGKYSY